MTEEEPSRYSKLHDHDSCGNNGLFCVQRVFSAFVEFKPLARARLWREHPTSRAYYYHAANARKISPLRIIKAKTRRNGHLFPLVYLTGSQIFIVFPHGEVTVTAQ